MTKNNKYSAIVNWLHSAVDLFLRFPRKVSHEDHIFILGCPRSGTTLLECIIAAHPNVASPGYETFGIFTFRGLLSYLRHTYKSDPRSKWSREEPDLIAFYDKVADECAKRSGAKRVVDKLINQNILIVGLCRRHFPEAKFVNIIRDGRDCFSSALSHGNIPQAKEVKGFARFWSRLVRFASDLNEKDERFFNIRYEDLVIAPEASTKEIMQFLGEEYMHEQIDSDNFSRTTDLHKRKKHANLLKPIGAESIGKYKKTLSAGQIRDFNRIAGCELKNMGYTI